MKVKEEFVDLGGTKFGIRTEYETHHTLSVISSCDLPGSAKTICFLTHGM